MKREEKVNLILTRVAYGVWLARETALGPQRQCAFCGRAPDAGCAPDCTSRMARELIADDDPSDS